MTSSVDCPPTLATSTITPVSRRQRMLLAAVKAGRCQVTLGPLPTLLIDSRCSCDQLAAYELLAAGLVRPSVGGSQPGELVAAAVLSPEGERALAAAD